MFNVRLAGDHLYENLAFAGGVFDGALFVLSFRCPLDVFDEIWDLIESVSNVFLPTFDFYAFS